MSAFNYNWITDELAVGSCPVTPGDVDILAADGISGVMSLQTEEDLAYWNVNLEVLKGQYEAHTMRFVHSPVPDFQPAVLGRSLPGLVKQLEVLVHDHAPVYLHCNVGVNRSPTTAIAWLYLIKGWPLAKAASLLSEKRPVCIPYVEVIPESLDA